MFTRFIKRAAVPAVGTMLYLHQQPKNNTSAFTQSIARDFSQPEALKQKLSCYRPNDWAHIHYAVQVYQNNGGALLNKEGWELIKIYQEVENSYFGAAYINKEKQHIIIAHRGTQDFKDWVCDFKTAVHHLNQQQVSAWDEFAKKIVETHGPDYTYSFTGHSLGGWLAELCLWKYQDEFVKDRYPAYQDAFSVTLDDPGGKELLEALQPRTEKSYKLALNKLDRTNYVSRPNLVNTALGRDGATTYALLVDQKLSWFAYYTPLFTAKMHGSEMLLKEFSEETGLPKKCSRVLDWPRIIWGKTLPHNQDGIVGYLAHALKFYLAGDIQRGEYLGFYTYSTDAVNNPQTLAPASQFKLQHGIHYRTKAYQLEVLPLRNMPTVARQFLEDLSAYPDRAKVITELMGNPLPFGDLLNAYRINEHEECVLNSKTSALAFRDQVLKFLTDNPMFYQTKLAMLREEYILKQATTGSPLKLLEGLREQVQRSQELVFKLSFDRGTARLYKSSKPTWDEMRHIEEEHFSFKKQLTALQFLKLDLKASTLEPAVKTEANALLEQHEQQLQIAEQGALILMDYLKDKLNEAESHANQLIARLEKPNFSLPDLDKNLLLNRAYNLKAKIAASSGNLISAQKYYQQAEHLLPQDVLTQSNYGGLLTDLGRSTQQPKHYVEAYRCFQKVYPYLQQLKHTERPVASSGMAYGFILLAQSLEQKSIFDVDMPNSQVLRAQAQSLLKEAVSLNPHYPNARLFLGLLAYDEKDYPRALQEVNMALILDPTHPTAMRRKGFILDKLGNSSEALEALREAKQRLSSQGAKRNAGWLKEIDDKILEIEGRFATTGKPKL